MEHNNTNVEEYIVENVKATADIRIALNNIENDDKFSDSILSSYECEYSQNNCEISNEEDGFIYICGWFARKFKNKYPHLGNYTKDKKPNHSYSTPNWIQHLLYGGLTEPTANWIKIAEVFENMFKKFYKKKEINPDTDIVKRLTNLIKRKCHDMPEDLIKAFVLQRTHIRIEKLNNNLIDERKKPLNNTDGK